MRGMVRRWTCSNGLAARTCPSFAQWTSPSTTEGAGKAGRRLGPRSACRQKARGRTTGQPRHTRPSLHDVWTAYTYSPRGPALLPPSPTDHRHRRLGISIGMPGPYDFAVRLGPFVGTTKVMLRPETPTASRSACRDDRDTPFVPGRDDVNQSRFLIKRNSKIVGPRLGRSNRLEGTDENSPCAQAVLAPGAPAEAGKRAVSRN